MACQIRNYLVCAIIRMKATVKLIKAKLNLDTVFEETQCQPIFASVQR